MSPNPATRASLLIRLRQAEDAEAWGEFVEVYEPLILRLARRSGLQEADAVEIVQEVLTRVARSIPHWKSSGKPGAFRCWLNRVTRHLVIQFFRDRGRWPRAASDESLDQVAQPAGEEARWFDLELQRQWFAWAAVRLRDRFEETTWQAFWRTAVDHRSVEAVAGELGLTRGAVYVARSRVMSALRRAAEDKLSEC